MIPRPSASRIPLPTHIYEQSAGSSTDPFSLGSSTKKRGASEAFDANGLDSSTSRRPLNGSMSTASLQRRILELEAKEREGQMEIDELRSENARLNTERRMLHEGEEQERSTGQEREKQFSEERLELNARLKRTRTENEKLVNEMARLQSEHTQLSSKYAQLMTNSSSEIQLLTQRLREVESDRDQLKGWERRAKGLSIDLEEERRRAVEGRREAEDDKEDKRVEEVMRNELKRQSQHLSSLEKRSSSLQIEVADLRQKKKEYEANERAAKDVERALRDDIRMLHDQLDRARREMDSLTQTFPSTSSPEIDASTLQQRLQALSTLHNQTSAELATKETEYNALHARLTQLSIDSQHTNRELSKQLTEMRNEARWAKEALALAERKEVLARQEIKALRSASDGPRMPGGVVSDQSGRVKQLEVLLEGYKSQLEAIAHDSRDLEDRLTQGAGLVKQSTLDEAQEKISQLTTEIESLESTISALTSANTTLDAEVNDLMRRVASGEYNPERERCIELRSNPASKTKAIRSEELEKLKRENEALLDRLSEAGRSADGEKGGIPIESFERLRAEKEDLEKAHAKRLQRLKEIFGTKSKEFLEAVYSLLGWRIKFDESGTDIRLTSMYAPKGKMGLTLKFASQEGHFGTMQMTGALARGLEDTRHFWIVERQSVPGFLAQVTVEMFEKTTIGCAAGYVGFE